MTAGLFRETPLSWAIYTDLSLSTLSATGFHRDTCPWRLAGAEFAVKKDHLQGRSWAVRRPSSLKLPKCQRVGKWASNWRRHSFPQHITNSEIVWCVCVCVCGGGGGGGGTNNDFCDQKKKSGFFSSFF